jgi:hypothetical protein
MLDKLLSTAVSNAKLVVAGAIGAALVAGGGAVAVTQVASSSDASTAASEHANEHATLKGDNRSDTATAGIDLPKPSKSPKAEDGDEGAQGVHGACVSAVAQDKSTVGRDHGKAVSEAAHSCPKGGEDATGAATTADADESDDDADDGDEARPSKAPKPAKGERGRSSEHKPGND